MNVWRISKYNPKYRDRSGVYRRDEWTSSADIGKYFNSDDDVLSVEQYLDIEDKYISVVSSFFHESEIFSLGVNGLENYITSTRIEELKAAGLSLNAFNAHEGDELQIDEVLLVSRFALRELIWCKMEKQDKFYIHFGHDYYLFIGSYHDCTESIDHAKNVGLYVENFISPH